MQNREALWLTTKRGDLVIKAAPHSNPRPDEVLVRNRAIAINPVDWITQSLGDLFFPWIRYPFVMGSDVAGDIVEVGAQVSGFKVGDRILGHAVGLDKTRNSSTEGAFQTHTILLAHMAARIPADMSYEHAVVLPLGLSTAGCGLFEAAQLGLQHPSVQPKQTGKTVLIWGGATSVGSNAIQLAVAAGYDVFTTTSPKNFDYAKSLGADRVFDYRSPSVVRDIIAAFDGRTLAGALAIGVGSADGCLDIVHKCRGDKAVSIATPSVSFADVPEGPDRWFWLLPTLTRLMVWTISMTIKSRMRKIRTTSIFSTSILTNEVSRVLYGEFLPRALEDGRYIAAPDPLISGRGLGLIAAALKTQKQGVSARKVVVSL